jgi:hypothetical protein
MRRSFVTRSLAACAVVVGILGVGLEPVIFGGVAEPPPPGQRITGPAIDGVITLLPNGTGSVSITVIGRCGSTLKTPVSLFGSLSSPVPFADIKPVNIEGQILNHPVIQQTCWPTDPTGSLIVTAVTKFANDGAVAGGDISISLMQSK